MIQFRKLPLAVLFGLSLCSSLLMGQERITAEIKDAVRVEIAGSRLPLTVSNPALGRLPAAMRIEGISIVFNHSAAQEAELNALLAAQQDTASPHYHQWLKPDQYAARFGMTRNDLDKVKGWLEQQGFTVDPVSSAQNQIRFAGTVSQIERSFRTEMRYYKVNGKQEFAPSTALSVPAAIAPTVLGITNLSSFRVRPVPLNKERAPGLAK